MGGLAFGQLGFGGGGVSMGAVPANAVLFNNAGVVDGRDTFTYDPATTVLTLGSAGAGSTSGSIKVGDASPGYGFRNGSGVGVGLSGTTTLALIAGGVAQALLNTSSLTLQNIVLNGSSASAGNLDLSSTSHATKGQIRLGGASGIIYDQAAGHLFIPGNGVGTHGQLQFSVANTYIRSLSGTGNELSIVVAGLQPFRLTSNTTVIGSDFGSGDETSANSLLVKSNKTIASAAGALWNGVRFRSSTATVTGTTQITTAAGFNFVSVDAPTITDSSAVTIDRASTIYVAGAPIAAGSAVITVKYAIFVDEGIVRCDGNGTHVFELPADATGNTQAATGRVPIRVGGATKYLRYFDQ